MVLLDSLVFCVLAFKTFCVGSGLVSPLFYPLTTIYLPCYYIFLPLPSPRRVWVLLVFFLKPEHDIASDVCSTCLTAPVFLIFYFKPKFEGVALTVASTEYYLKRLKLGSKVFLFSKLVKVTSEIFNFVI